MGDPAFQNQHTKLHVRIWFDGALFKLDHYRIDPGRRIEDPGGRSGSATGDDLEMGPRCACPGVETGRTQGTEGARK